MARQENIQHPFIVLESYGVECSWNDNTMLAIACDFLQMQGLENPALLGAFQRYVEDRMNEDLEAGRSENADLDELEG